MTFTLSVRIALPIVKSLAAMATASVNTVLETLLP